MEAKANGVEGVEGGKKTPPQNARTETHLSVLTPTSANRCDQFNEACALDLALLSGGEDLLSEKASHCTSYPVHRSMPGIPTASKLARRVVCGNHATPTGGPDSLCQRDTRSSRLPFQKSGPARPCLPLLNERRQTWPFSNTSLFGGKSSNAGTRETWRQRKENTREYHRQNSVGKDPKSRSKSPRLRELHSHLLFFFFFRAAWF